MRAIYGTKQWVVVSVSLVGMLASLAAAKDPPRLIAGELRPADKGQDLEMTSLADMEA